MTATAVYKNELEGSGIGSLPPNWEVNKFGREVQLQEGPGIMAADFVDDGIPLIRVAGVKGQFATLDGCNYLDAKKVSEKWEHFRLTPGDLLISASASTGLISEVDSTTVGSIPYTGIIRLKPWKRVTKEYLKYYISSKLFESQVDVLKAGSTIQHYGPTHLKDFKLIVPPIDIQQAIASFLDQKTSKLDTLIAKKTEFIERLKEKRTALISQVVTKGLPPEEAKKHGFPVNPKMKPSGVEWLGEIPEHWSVKKIKHISSLRSGKSITSEDIEDEADFPVYGGNGLRGYYHNYTHQGHFVLIGRQGALCGNINYANGTFWASEHAVVCNPLTQYATLWFGELLRFMNLNQYSEASAQPGLAAEKIRNLRIPVPPLAEQKLISTFLELHLSKIDKLVKKVECAIVGLEEYRSALITAAVTGKIDVREMSV